MPFPQNLFELNPQEFCRRQGRPTVTLSYAQSLDGSIARERGGPLALSSPESRLMTHGLRAMHDAILIGIGTVLADDPQLTVRLLKGPDPRPVVLDSHLRLPLNCNLLRNPLPALIATTGEASRLRQSLLEEQGGEIVRLSADENGWVDLPSLLAELARRGVSSLMVEGGARVITSFLAQGLVDRLVITIAPILVGGLRPLENTLADKGPKNLSPHCSLQFSDFGYRRAGRDLIFWSVVDRGKGTIS